MASTSAVSGEYCWADELGASVMVTDRDMVVKYLNNAAAVVYEKWGGKALLGKEIKSCHTPASVQKMQALIDTGVPKTYTIEKNGKKKFIYHAPTFQNGVISGIIEMQFPIEELPHFNRS
ncbi:PAS fold domain protein [Pelomyxa schiedti]|nr:PAS fold domain protein [Pelomyxa schiedti]